MKTLIKTTVSALAVAGLLTASSAFAGPQMGDRDWQKGPPRVEERLARISWALGLSDEQSAEMLLILQDQERSRSALHEQTMAIMGAEICAQRLQTEEAMLSILDGEQKELFLQMKEERLAQRENRKHTRPGRDAPDCASEEGDY